MAAIRSAAEIASKWAKVTPQRVDDYRAGVENPKKDWATETGKANGAWKEGITQAIAKDRFSKGVSKAGTDTWQKGAITKGTARWGPGVALAEDKYRAGFEPYQQAIAGLNLPQRFARRDPRNLDRVKAVVDVLRATKERLSG